LAVLTIRQEIKGKPERAYTVSLERDEKPPRMVSLKRASHRTALYKTKKRLSEEYLRQLNDKVLEGVETSKKLGANATRMCSQGGTASGLQQVKMAEEDTLSSTHYLTLKSEPLRLLLRREEQNMNASIC
jgi:hypothetical protein